MDSVTIREAYCPQPDQEDNTVPLGLSGLARPINISSSHVHSLVPHKCSLEARQTIMATEPNQPAAFAQQQKRIDDLERQLIEYHDDLAIRDGKIDDLTARQMRVDTKIASLEKVAEEKERQCQEKDSTIERLQKSNEMATKTGKSQGEREGRKAGEAEAKKAKAAEREASEAYQKMKRQHEKLAAEKQKLDAKLSKAQADYESLKKANLQDRISFEEHQKEVNHHLDELRGQVAELLGQAEPADDAEATGRSLEEELDQAVEKERDASESICKAPADDAINPPNAGQSAESGKDSIRPEYVNSGTTTEPVEFAEDLPPPADWLQRLAIHTWSGQKVMLVGVIIFTFIWLLLEIFDMNFAYLGGQAESILKANELTQQSVMSLRNYGITNGFQYMTRFGFDNVRSRNSNVILYTLNNILTWIWRDDLALDKLEFYLLDTLGGSSWVEDLHMLG